MSAACAFYNATTPYGQAQDGADTERKKHPCGRLLSFRHFKDGVFEAEQELEAEEASGEITSDEVKKATRALVPLPELNFQQMGTTEPFITLVKVEILDVCGVVPAARLRKPRVVVSVGGEQSDANALKCHTKIGAQRKISTKGKAKSAKIQAVTSKGSIEDESALRKLDTFAQAGLDTHFEFEGAAYFVVNVSDRPIHIIFKQPNTAKKAVGGFFKKIVDLTGNLGTMLKVFCCPCHACFNAITCGGSASAPVAGASIPYGELDYGAQTLKMELLPAKNIEIDDEGVLHNVALRTTRETVRQGPSATDSARDSTTSAGGATATDTSSADPARGTVKEAGSQKSVSLSASKKGWINSRVVQPQMDANSEEVGLMTVRVTLTPMRDTRDGGNYNGPDLMMIEGRLRDMTRRPLRAINEDNHWLCSHNNVFCVGDEGTKPYVWGRFEYGSRRLKNEAVHLFAKQHDSMESYRFLDTVYTNDKGILRYECPPFVATQPGHYAIRAVVASDNTIGHGSLYILEKGTRAVVLDLDGTINVGDEQMVGQMIYDFAGQARAFDAVSRANGLSLCRYWAAKGYLPVYLTGRQGSFYNLTFEWLAKHGFPPGPVILTTSKMAALPGKGTFAGYQFVRDFKVGVMNHLASIGVESWAAYGNVATDVSAYKNAKVPKERTFIIGNKAGMKDTMAVTNFTEHLDFLTGWLEPAPIPTPWKALFF